MPGAARTGRSHPGVGKQLWGRKQLDEIGAAGEGGGHTSVQGLDVCMLTLTFSLSDGSGPRSWALPGAPPGGVTCPGDLCPRVPTSLGLCAPG